VGEANSRRAAAAAALRGARRVLCTAHEPVDGDGAGSALGFARGLRLLGREAVAVFPAPLPPHLRFLPGAAEAGVASAAGLPPGVPEPDLVVVFDTASAHRLGALLPVALRAAALVVVDHHASHEDFGTVCWVDPSYAAAGAMAFDLLADLGVRLDREAALCLYTALVADTGGFSFSNTDPRSHRMAAACLEAGARPEEVTAALYRTRTPGSWRLEAEAIERMRTSPDGAVAWTSVTRDMFRRHRTGPEEMHDLVGIPVSLGPTRVGVLFEERVDVPGTRVSLRSRCALGVHRVAARFGGGGHPRAAGCSHPGNLEEAERAVLAEVEAALRDLARAQGDGALPVQDA